MWIIAAAVLVILAAGVTVLLNNRPYEVLVTGVSAGETASILSFLEGQGVTDYKVQGNDTILVPKSQVSTLKMRILMEGYPQTGYAYSTYYDHVGALSTESERSNAYLMFLMESMSNVIRTFENVKDAQVLISPGEDRSYVLDSGNVVKAKASVQVTMQGAAKLTGQQVTAIRNLVAHGVQGLEIGSVAISDTLGNTYTADASAAAGDASALKLQLEEDYENKIRTQVMQALSPFFGEDNVRVGVSCVVELSQKTVSSKDVQLPAWAQDGSTGGKGIIGSQIYEYYVNRTEDETVGGLVGSETNSDLPEYVEREADPDGSEKNLGGSGQTDYDNPYTQTEAVYTAGYLQDCSVAVSINAASAGSANLDSIRQHVARAAGIVGAVDTATGQEDLSGRISVVVMNFYDPSVPVPPKQTLADNWVVLAAAGGLGLFLLIVLVALALRRRRRKKAQAQQQAALDEMLAAVGFAPAADGKHADVMTLQTEKSMELRKEIRQFANDNPEIAAQMVRSWLKGAE